jgi:hypothetical protein
MRIVIDIEGSEVSARLEHAEGEDVPPELLRRAKALGAMNAGSAPAEPDAARGAAVTLAAATVSKMLEPAKAGAAPVEAAGEVRRAKSPRGAAARKKRKSR